LLILKGKTTVGSKTKIALAAMLIGSMTMLPACSEGPKAPPKGSGDAGGVKDDAKGATKGQGGGEATKMKAD
jgi:hypothetical protein